MHVCQGAPYSKTESPENGKNSYGKLGMVDEACDGAPRSEGQKKNLEMVSVLNPFKILKKEKNPRSRLPPS